MKSPIVNWQKNCELYYLIRILVIKIRLCMHEAGDQERLLTNILLAITDSKNLHYVNYIEVFSQGNVRDLTYIYGSQNMLC